MDENLAKEIHGILAAADSPLTTREIYAKTEQADGVATVATALHHMVQRREARAITVIEGPRKFVLDDGKGQASTHAWRKPWKDGKHSKSGAREGVLGALTSGPKTTAQLREAMPDLGQHALRNALSSLRREGKIDNDGRGTPWHLAGPENAGESHRPTTDEVREHVKETAARITGGSDVSDDDSPLTPDQVKQKLNELSEQTQGIAPGLSSSDPLLSGMTWEAPEQEPDEFFCALDSKGRLRLFQDGQQMVVSPKNAQTVRTYLMAFAYTTFDRRAANE